MTFQMFFAVAFPLCFSLSTAENEPSVCISSASRSCADCVQVSESCGWCSHESFLKPMESVTSRCDDVQSLLNRNCPSENIMNPRGSISIQKNLQLTEHVTHSYDQVVQIHPQKLSLSLRKGEAQTFSVNFKLAENLPIDLYYLLDLTSSMKDHLQNAKNLGLDLMMEMKRVSSDVRIGLGVIMKSGSAPGSLTFKNLLSLTDKAEEFSLLLRQLQIHDNMDSTQGGLRYIQQVALCEEQVGWRSSVRLLIVSTAVGFSSAAESTTVTQSSGQCRLENNTYTGEGQVLLSVSDLAQTLTDQNIRSIFTVTENVLSHYQTLQNLLPKSAVGTLTSNSSNIIQLITDAYNSLSSEVILENSRLPEGVSISYKSLCKNGVEGTGDDGRKCSNVSIGDKVSFEITISPQEFHIRSNLVKIKPVGINEEVEVDLTFLSECQCSGQAVAHSDMCSRSGTFECGVCRCNEGRLGPRCECDVDEMWSSDPESACRRDQSSEVCSNNGECVCGACECKRRENPEERYSGRFCECDNFNCDRSNNKLCGGHGRCECRVCICDANYTGSACDCSLDETPCLSSNGQICNGRGLCQCGVCKCTDPKFQGPTCELCPTCPGVCTQHKDCVECRAFGKGSKADSCSSDCSYLTLTTVQSVDDLPQPFDQDVPLRHCKERTLDDCWYYFTYSLRNGAHQVTVAQQQACPTTSLLDLLG